MYRCHFPCQRSWLTDCLELTRIPLRYQANGKYLAGLPACIRFVINLLVYATTYESSHDSWLDCCRENNFYSLLFSVFVFLAAPSVLCLALSDFAPYLLINRTSVERLYELDKKRWKWGRQTRVSNSAQLAAGKGARMLNLHLHIRGWKRNTGNKKANGIIENHISTFYNHF